MNEHRKDILDMLAEGKITAEEAERLITALERDQPPTAAGPAARPKGKAKYLRVVMEFLDDGESGRLNVRIPLQLLRAGVQLAALIPPQALDRANAELSKSGVPFDLTQLKPEHLEALVEHLDETIVELEQPDGHLRVFCE
ncbi:MULTISPECIES: SHOCT-like domain-containing protein [Nonomuraea]|uniref:YvlB/LiaX N-terminal domain-containing protein n=1 Tax=Nonomuraea mangrovi TaxID=2316207 RepID=A0ABW4T974_9ACTN